MPEIAQPKKAREELQEQFSDKITGYIVGGFGLVAGLAWNDAIKALIELLFPQQESTMLAKFIYAAIMTIVLVVISVYLSRLFHRKEKSK